MYILGIDPASTGAYWAWLYRDSHGQAHCCGPDASERRFGFISSDNTALLPPALMEMPAADRIVALEDFTFMSRQIGGPGLRTVFNSGRIVQTCRDHDIACHIVSRQKVKGHLGIGRASRKRSPLVKGMTEVDLANRQAVRMRGICVDFMTRDHIAAISVALTVEAILTVERTMEGLR